MAGQHFVFTAVFIRLNFADNGRNQYTIGFDTLHHIVQPFPFIKMKRMLLKHADFFDGKNSNGNRVAYRFFRMLLFGRLVLNLVVDSEQIVDGFDFRVEFGPLSRHQASTSFASSM